MFQPHPFFISLSLDYNKLCAPKKGFTPMTILSVSRRTDIPAFYSDWFINRIKEEYVLYPLPKSQKLKHLDLTPKTIDCIVFWSKNYEHLINHLNFLDSKGFQYLFHFTINNYPENLEFNVIKFHEAVEQFHSLSKHTSPEHVLWRYDPIIITSNLTTNFHLYNFENIASKIQGLTKKCYIEFVDIYKKVDKNFKKHNINPITLSQQQKLNLLESLAKVAFKYDIQVYACCDHSLTSDHVKKASCIDPILIEKIIGKPISYKYSPTRPDCGCAKSIDIGEFGTCLHGCLYCYAASDQNSTSDFKDNFNNNSPAFNQNKHLQNSNPPPPQEDQLKLF